MRGVKGVDFGRWVVGVFRAPAARDSGVEDGEGGGDDTEDEVDGCPGHDTGKVPWGVSQGVGYSVLKGEKSDIHVKSR